MIMRTELTKQMSQVTLTEDHEVIETLRSERLHESLCMGIAVWTACWDGHAVDAFGLEQCCPRLRVQRVAIVNEVGGVAQEPILRVEQVSSHLQHPGPVRSDADARDVHGARLQLDDEEDHVTDASEDSQRLDSKEVASVERLPVAAHEVLPGTFAGTLRRRLEAGLYQDVRYRRAADVNLQPAQCVTDLGVAPA